MGLDMYLTEIEEWDCEFGDGDDGDILISWRKANQIHKWFVDNAQGGVDDCGTYEIQPNKLKELKDLCSKVLKTKKTKLLPPQKGFFFGSSEVDEDYYSDLEITS